MIKTVADRSLVLIVLAVLALAPSCGGTDLSPTDPNNLQVKGAVRYYTLEGGFWAIRGDDGVTYEPSQPLDAKLRHEGLRVWFEGKIRRDLAGIHMAGPIVDIVQIKVL